MTNIPPQACIDEKDERDYKYTETFGVTGDLPDYVIYDKTTIYNQGAINTPNTSFACTCYGATHCVNEGNAYEAQKFGTTLDREVDPVIIWSQALQLGAKLDSGWSLQGATRLMMNLGCITGYTLCRSIGEVKQALARGQQVYTGSNQIDWARTKKNDMIVVEGSSYGHAFKIDGYDDNKELLIMRNSYGPNEYAHGRFFLKYKDFDLLYSCYAYADNASPEIRETQKKKRIELAVKAGVFNGKNLDEELIRQDAVTMVTKTCKYDEPGDLWNKKNGLMPIIQRDLKTMFKKAGKTITWVINEEKTITRGEAGEWCGRLL